MAHIGTPEFEIYVATRRAAGQPVVPELACGFRKVPGAFGVDAVRFATSTLCTI